MPHPLVDQLRFTRSEFQRGLEGITDEEARRRIEPMNCISWNIGHLASQEQRYWIVFGMGQKPLSEVADQFRSGAPASTPALAEVQEAWQAITSASDQWLDAVTTEKLQEPLVRDGKHTEYLYGSLLLRVIYHYWYHTGENLAIRQNLGHTGLPDFVGEIDTEAPYRPEP